MTQTVKPTVHTLDLTLRGWHEVEDYRNRKIVPDEARRMYDDLVKWIGVQSDVKEERFKAINAFIEKNNLQDILEGRPFETGRIGKWATIKDGLDFIIDHEGNVVEGDLADLGRWREQVSKMDRLLESFRREQKK
jgi:hypothetical protein